MATSPQSTLCNVLGGGCACSSRGSPNCTSPPPSKVVNQNDTAWSLLYEAAGEVEKMRRFDEAAAKARAAHFGAARKPNNPNPVFVQAKNTRNSNSNPGLYANQSMSYQLQANQVCFEPKVIMNLSFVSNFRAFLFLFFVTVSADEATASDETAAATGE